MRPFGLCVYAREHPRISRGFALSQKHMIVPRVGNLTFSMIRPCFGGESIRPYTEVCPTRIDRVAGRDDGDLTSSLSRRGLGARSETYETLLAPFEQGCYLR